MKKNKGRNKSKNKGRNKNKSKNKNKNKNKKFEKEYQKIISNNAYNITNNRKFKNKDFQEEYRRIVMVHNKNLMFWHYLTILDYFKILGILSLSVILFIPLLGFSIGESINWEKFVIYVILGGAFFYIDYFLQKKKTTYIYKSISNRELLYVYLKELGIKMSKKGLDKKKILLYEKMLK